MSLVQPGLLPLDPAQSRHARLVLRLPEGEPVEVFDDVGRSAQGVLIHDGDSAAAVRVESVADTVATPRLRWTIAAAVPKGDRADWMVEKLSELGADAFIPLAAARSVVLPEGKGKRDRWIRLATESAKQCRRTGVMRIGELTSVADLLKTLSRTDPPGAWYFSTAPGALPAGDAMRQIRIEQPITLFVGPEGGWTDQEIATFDAAGLLAVKLTSTILRIETAAVAAGGLVACLTPG